MNVKKTEEKLQKVTKRQKALSSMIVDGPIAATMLKSLALARYDRKIAKLNKKIDGV